LARAHNVAPRTIFRCLGTMSLSSLGIGSFLIEWAPAARVGEGGVERWVIYR
jgi:hypothetical protein